MSDARAVEEFGRRADRVEVAELIIRRARKAWSCEARSHVDACELAIAADTDYVEATAGSYAFDRSVRFSQACAQRLGWRPDGGERQQPRRVNDR